MLSQLEMHQGSENATVCTVHTSILNLISQQWLSYIYISDQNEVAHMSRLVSLISLNGNLHFNIKSHRLFFIQYNTTDAILHNRKKRGGGMETQIA